MTPALPTLDLEGRLLAQTPLIIALDEVGRGALAGPVAVGAVIIDAAVVAVGIPEGLRDSKLVPEKRRAEVAARAQAWALADAVGWAQAAEIDEIGIVPALGLAAARAIRAAAAQLPVDPARAIVLLDGNHDYVSAAYGPGLDVRTVIKGDRDCASMSAASVIAKVARDERMARIARDFPRYEWEKNKGYASAAHRAAIREIGLTDHHRKSWAITDAPALF
ncbi:MAG: ribonuclease HII [Microbacterium sp.]